MTAMAGGSPARKREGQTYSSRPYTVPDFPVRKTKQ